MIRVCLEGEVHGVGVLLEEVPAGQGRWYSSLIPNGTFRKALCLGMIGLAMGTESLRGGHSVSTPYLCRFSWEGKEEERTGLR